MTFVLQPWQLYLVILAGWINRQQQELIEYLRTEKSDSAKSRCGMPSRITSAISTKNEITLLFERF